ncbi:hypothetical protein FGG78_21780 [Thioclava sp. BHET1]|nr:hypothetical protein FGG78_21780 [Thioclava sp. BHET1]
MLTAEQRRILALADMTGLIRYGDDAQCPGIHFCPDHRGAPICDASPEHISCTCSFAEAHWRERAAS